MKSAIRIVLAVVAFLTGMILADLVAESQPVEPVPKLDQKAMMQTWYEVARYPVRREKKCGDDEQVLYALGDKQNSFLVVTECRLKNNAHNWWDDNGLLDKSGGGELRIRFWLIFHRKYWVLAQDPQWMIVGTPNHRSLWLLASTQTPPSETVEAMKAKAASEGFDLKKLVVIRQKLPTER